MRKEPEIEAPGTNKEIGAVNRIAGTLLVLGLNHRSAPVALRERLAVGPCGLSKALKEFAACGLREGLDSMILGESEITAQVKQAYLSAQSLGSTGAVLNALFQKALHCTKIIRSQTRIAEGHASIGSIVVMLAKQLFGAGFSGSKVLMWGHDPPPHKGGHRAAAHCEPHAEQGAGVGRAVPQLLALVGAGGPAS